MSKTIYKCTRPKSSYWQYCEVTETTYRFFNGDGSVQLDDDGVTPCIHKGTPPATYQPMEHEVIKKILKSYVKFE